MYAHNLSRNIIHTCSEMYIDTSENKGKVRIDDYKLMSRISLFYTIHPEHIPYLHTKLLRMTDTNTFYKKYADIISRIATVDTFFPILYQSVMYKIRTDMVIDVYTFNFNLLKETCLLKGDFVCRIIHWMQQTFNQICSFVKFMICVLPLVQLVISIG